ncbi:molybdopterin biosynthesis protein MoeA [Neokomagataea thailandica NBRC 106555]|uniref:Molybdopterin molybdenumtransferase n=2 Tax=Neokomagataea TaxID=1223423 RepID=A0A4Y6V8H5_9PROT|nr:MULTISPECIES: molybdopterin molybdotransferase MoeA [Neokomagataea]QDH24980.1 molybdopterin molybdenumtransferase MoeA [Neokomagataea tanensis]GBR51567.1 molybdopterin biosynthesis protein MoeA [Neokomagataea thailandica NBRC 106555]
MNELIAVDRASSLVWEHAGDFGTVRVPLNKAVGRTLRQVVRAERDQPPCDRAAVNGYAVCSASIPSNGVLHVTGLQRAGRAPLEFPQNDGCLEILTGAIIPSGADVVIPGERVQRQGDFITVEPEALPEVGAFIDRQGTVRQENSPLLEPGIVLKGPVLAVLAANGLRDVLVAADPSIGVFAVGDSLIAVDDDGEEGLAPWEIRRSSEYAITGALNDFGFKRGQRRHVANVSHEIHNALAEELATHDVLILGEGGPFGAKSAVADALRDLGVNILFDGVAQEPGAAFWFGVGPEGQRVFGLPADSVGITVCMRRYVLPLLKRGQQRLIGKPPRVALAEAVHALKGLTRFAAVGVEHDQTGRALAYPRNIVVSGEFGSLLEVDGFVEVAPALTEADKEREVVPFYGV